jgi:hypothetical protein
MAYGVCFLGPIYAIGYQPYANLARLASEILLSSLQTEFFSKLPGLNMARGNSRHDGAVKW